MKNSPNVEAMMDIIASDQQVMPERNYLGASAIGHPCKYKSWLEFRMASLQNFPASTLLKFEDGHHSEFLTATRLRKIKGINLSTYVNGEQQGFAALGGHFRGHYDGTITGLIDDEYTTYIWEHKCVDQTKFNALQRLKNKDEGNALELWNEIYFAQAQIYMDYRNLKNHFLTVSTSGSRQYLEVKTKYNERAAKDLTQKAISIIFDKDIPEKIGRKAQKKWCSFCSEYTVCQQAKIPLPTCRSCLFSRPIYDAKKKAIWRCEKHKKMLYFDDQKRGCLDHLYEPKMLINFANQLDYSDENVLYESKENYILFSNGKDKNSLSSHWLYFNQLTENNNIETDKNESYEQWKNQL